MMLLLLALLAQLSPFEQDGRWGYRDDAGRVAIEPRFAHAEPFSPQGIAAVVDGAGWAYIDANGRILIRPLVVDNGPDYFQENLARFRDGGRVGFFDRAGRVGIAPRFAFARPFSEGLAAVCRGCTEVREGEHSAVRGGKWGYIDRSGRVAIPLQFEEAGSFENGVAVVTRKGKRLRIDKSGARVTGGAGS